MPRQARPPPPAWGAWPCAGPQLIRKQDFGPRRSAGGVRLLYPQSDCRQSA
eukprot:CAMPEP_0183815294 /NCGR_PEP_ID=MMETSP0803_2-20130417/56656_1 /TAXON_ID=195967 /ORGANISM="Crustomastix stigmata, Strain CCMP3273" /LENGTH=50 /DNA_ID=CAMNT_0026060159 /DNA_START=70 /DNA_END=222 /DNA_ORIENTATION=-